MVRIREAIVVEGKYDQNTLRQLVDTAVIPTHGFGVMKNRELLAFLRTVAEKRGLDSPHRLRRGRICDPELSERRAAEGAGAPRLYPGYRREGAAEKGPGKEGKLGVEGMEPAVLLEALRRAGATFLDEAAEAPAGTPITKADLYEWGLSGGPDSREKRLALLKTLNLPSHMSANALLEALNLLYTKETFLRDFHPEGPIPPRAGA